MATPQAHWSSSSVLVTGIAGFIGSGLAEALCRHGASVVGIVRDFTAVDLLQARGIHDRVTVVRGSITEPGVVERTLNEYEVDTVFHLAAQSQVKVANRSPLSTFETNIAGTWQVLEAARRISTVERVVVASSDKAYGIQRQLPYTEDSALEGSFPYDASKTCTDVLARCYAATYRLPLAILRCANVYGPGDLNWARLVPGTIRSALLGERPLIRSDGSPERDYIYLDDAVEAYLLAALALPSVAGEAFNAGSGSPVAVTELVNRILSIAGVPELEPQIAADAPSEIDRQYLASGKAERLLGWGVTVGLDEGLKRSLSWYRSFLQADDSRPERLVGLQS